MNVSRQAMSLDAGWGIRPAVILSEGREGEMQYLLTEQERAALVSRDSFEALERALEWCFVRLQPKHCPYLVEDPDLYCDDSGGCPLESQTMTKRADSPPREVSRLICKLDRSYGK